jgi:hypothetical protein
MKAQTGSSGVALSFNLGARQGLAVSATPWPLYVQEGDPVLILQEAERTPGLVQTGVENLAPPLGFDPCAVRPVARRYTNCVVPAHHQTLSTNSNHLTYGKAAAFL